MNGEGIEMRLTTMIINKRFKGCLAGKIFDVLHGIYSSEAKNLFDESKESFVLPNPNSEC